MKRLFVAPIAALAVLAIGAGPRDARAESTVREPHLQPAEIQVNCTVRGLTPGRARNAEPARHQIAWNPVEAAQLVRDGENLEVKLEGAGGVLRGEVAYVLTGVELLPREGSERYPAEARFIHQRAGGDQVVVGVYVTEGAANPAIEPLRHALEADDPDALAGLDPRALLPDSNARLVLADRNDRDCAPRITWTVLDEPIEVSHEQLAVLLPAADGSAG